jgi:hypothetical protein
MIILTCFLMDRNQIQLKVAKSPKQRAEVRRDAVGPFEYDVQYALHLTVLTVAMAYSSMVRSD